MHYHRRGRMGHHEVALLLALIGIASCGSDTEADGTSSVGASSTSTSTSTSAGAGGSTAECQLPNCKNPVRLCEGGQCECQCADPRACPSGAAESTPPLTCINPEDICTYSGGCCLCGVWPSCGPDPVWLCTQPNGASCPSDPPSAGSACT